MTIGASLKFSMRQVILNTFHLFFIDSFGNLIFEGCAGANMVDQGKYKDQENCSKFLTCYDRDDGSYTLWSITCDPVEGRNRFMWNQDKNNCTP